jgi:methylthioribulose-1-phosphate dehydratase
MSAVAKLENSAEEAIEAIIAAGKHANSRGWVPATAGNFSVRVGDQIAITRTGRDKGTLTPEDIAIVSLANPDTADLSAEAPLHLARYAADPEIGAVFHVHNPVGAILGRRHLEEGALYLTGWELQKALTGVSTHEQTVRLPIVANSQDTYALALVAEAALARSDDALTAPGYLVSGHGLYAWGRRAEDALRHLDAFDALLLLHARWSGL